MEDGVVALGQGFDLLGQTGAHHVGGEGAVVGNEQIEEEIGVQRTGGDAEIVDGQGGVDGLGQFCHLIAQGQGALVHDDGIHVDDRLNVMLGLQFPLDMVDDVMDDELRIAFDFDGVIADDDSEKIYQEHGLSAFHRHEATTKAPLDPGPLADLLIKISNLQKLEMARIEEDSEYRRKLKISIVTARNAPAHERVVNTLKNWGVDVTEAFFLGGISKDRVLEIMRPHIFFDDQMSHLDHLKNVPAVHIPMGITNE